MNNSKLPHAFFGMSVSWAGTLWAWFKTNGATVATVIAIIASICTIWAAVETIRLRRKQQKEIDYYEDN